MLKSFVQREALNGVKSEGISGSCNWVGETVRLMTLQAESEKRAGD